MEIVMSQDPKKAVKARITDDEKFNLANAGSATDCTGLIQTGPLSDYEREAYKAIYSYEGPDPDEIKE